MTDGILGIQIGSGMVYAKVYSLSGLLLGTGEERLQIYHTPAQYCELDAGELWGAVCRALKCSLEGLENVTITCVGVSSVGESHVLLDRHGDPLARVIAWYDQRATQQAEALRRCIGNEEIYTQTGQFISPKFGICKTMWVRDNTPEIFSRIHRLLTLHDYIIYRLTGQAVTEYSMASRMMCFDIQKLRWSMELLHIARLSESCLPDVLPGASPAGTVTASASRLTGLKEGTPVITGGHDHACAAVAVNIFQDSVMMDSMENSETTVVATSKRLDIQKGFQNQIAIYPHFGSKLYRALTSVQAFGAVFDWLKLWGCAGGEGEDSTWHLLHHLSFTEPPPKDLIFIPHLRGLQEETKARGAFLGIDETCSYTDMVRSVAEGLCFELRRRADACDTAFGEDYFSVRAVGEYSSSPMLMRMKATVIAKKIETTAHTDAITYGAALMGAIGVGLLAEEDLQDVFDANAVYTPEYRMIQKTQPRYRQYLRAHEELLGIYAKLQQTQEAVL